MLLGTLGAILLGNMLPGKGIVRACSGNKKRKEIVRAGQGKKWDFNAASIIKMNLDLMVFILEH